MRYPKIKKQHINIDVIAPSSSCGDDVVAKLRIENAVKTLNKKGHSVALSKNIYNTKYGVVSAPADIRANEFMDSYLNNDVDLIIAVRGGELELEILPYINFEAIKKCKNIKWFQGFSDNTVLTYTLTVSCDIATIYGSNFGDFGVKKWDVYTKQNYNFWFNNLETIKSSKKYQIKSLKNESGHELDGFNCTEKTVYKIITGQQSVEVSGRLLGGCLDILTNITGTKYDNTSNFLEKYKKDGFIWYLETCDLKEFDTIRALWNLKESGWFKYCKAILIGRPLMASQFENITAEETYLRVLKDLNVPIILDMDFGHVRPNFYVINGAIATVKVSNNKGEIKYILK